MEEIHESIKRSQALGLSGSRMEDSMSIINVTRDSFEQEVLQSAEPVLVDFWASWCAPCRMMGATLEEYTGLHPEQKIAKVNVDEEMELAQTYGVMSIPSLLIFLGGELLHQSTGYCTIQELEELLAQAR